jgi:hypothetical protein
MVGRQVTWVSTRHWIKTGKGTTGSRQETTLRNSAGSVTSVKSVPASEPGIGAKCISITSWPHSKGLPLMQTGPSHEVTKETDTYWTLWTTKWQVAYAIPKPKASTVVEALVTKFFCRFGVPLSYMVTRAVISRHIWYRRYGNAWEWERRALNPSTRNRTTRSSPTLKWPMSTCENLWHRTRGIGT